jgi:micrococcal nuclease
MRPRECYGPEATNWLTSRVNGRSVQVVPDSTQDSTDRYGRTLGYVEAGGDVGLEAVQSGYARAYRPRDGQPPQRYTSYVVAQESAKIERRGMWGVCHP